MHAQCGQGLIQGEDAARATAYSDIVDRAVIAQRERAIGDRYRRGGLGGPDVQGAHIEGGQAQDAVVGHAIQFLDARAAIRNGPHPGDDPGEIEDSTGTGHGDGHDGGASGAQRDAQRGDGGIVVIDAGAGEPVSGDGIGFV